MINIVRLASCYGTMERMGRQNPEEAALVTIEDIIHAIRAGRVRITHHTDEEAQSDHLSFDQIYSSVLRGEIIETYVDRAYHSLPPRSQTMDRLAYKETSR